MRTRLVRGRGPGASRTRPWGDQRPHRQRPRGEERQDPPPGGIATARLRRLAAADCGRAAREETRRAPGARHAAEALAPSVTPWLLTSQPPGKEGTRGTARPREEAAKPRPLVEGSSPPRPGQRPARALRPRARSGPVRTSGTMDG